MTYQVLYQPQAAEQLDQAISWSFERFPHQAHEWCSALLNAIESLENNPERCPLARESEFFDIPIRQLLFGTGKSIYRILFTIEANTVRILHVRFPGQSLLS